ncbi:MAG: phage antirepressor [Synergistaceae bacterium]|jgi:anti-repressor protein|nr:phage antirepressor [Synergistaceae bacterium]
MNENSALQVFSFEGRQVRVVEKDGLPWWVLKDVCDVLDIGNSRDVAARLDDDEKGVGIIDTLGGEQETTVVSESGLYNVILLSRKPEAKKFKRWVTHEILPSIRKHGAYMTPEVIERTLTSPDFIIKLATRLKEEQSKNAELEAKIAETHPKVLFADSVSASKTSILIGDLAKLIRQNGCEIGQKRMFQWLRDNGFLMKTGSSINIPTQRSMEMGLFEVLERVIDNPDGSIRITRTTKVTGKGQVYFVNRFVNPGLRLIGKTA